MSSRLLSYVWRARDERKEGYEEMMIVLFWKVFLSGFLLNSLIWNSFVQQAWKIIITTYCTGWYMLVIAKIYIGLVDKFCSLLRRQTQHIFIPLATSLLGLRLLNHAVGCWKGYTHIPTAVVVGVEPPILSGSWEEKVRPMDKNPRVFRFSHRLIN